MNPRSADEPPTPRHVGTFTPSFVSVLIPVYNGETVLPAQLRALTQQDFDGNWEVVVADNGSTDGTRAAAAAFAEALPDLRIVDASDIKGPSHARNIAADVAKGDLLLFCDADDVVAPGWMSALVTAAARAELLIGVGVVTRTPERDSVAGPDHTPIPTSYRFLPWGRTSNLAVHREAFERVGGFDEQRRFGEDADLCWRIQLAGYRFAFVPEAYAAFRDWGTPREVWTRQWAFGKAAPRLYADFAADGAPSDSLRMVFGDLLRLAVRTPVWLLTADGRLRWWMQLAGLAGRGVGILKLRFSA